MHYDSDLLYQHVRAIRARRSIPLDKTAADLAVDQWARHTYLAGLMSMPPAGRSRAQMKRHAIPNSRRHLPKGLNGHRYPSSGQCAPERVKNANGNWVIRPKSKV